MLGKIGFCFRSDDHRFFHDLDQLRIRSSLRSKETRRQDSGDMPLAAIEFFLLIFAERNGLWDGRNAVQMSSTI